MDPCPLIWADAVVRPHCLIKLACLPSAVLNGSGRVTHVRIDENPVKRAHDLCFDESAKETASQNTLRWKSENDSSEGLGCSVMTHCGIRQQI